MDRRTFLKNTVVVGVGAVASGIGKESLATEKSSPIKGEKNPKPKGATTTTKTANAKLLDRLPFAGKQDMEDATRGLVAPLPNNGIITNEKGEPVWDMRKFQFILDQEKAPDTVNPSLWRQSRLVMQGGLFKVVDGLYQVRNADLSNLTVVEGETGIIIFDPLVSTQTARAALELYYRHRPRKPVVAVVFSHSHVDHYGGVRGVVSEDDVKATYVKYLGWFDGNPANLHVLPPEEAAEKFVEFMGGEKASMEKAQKAYDKGEYRWLAEVMNHVVLPILTTRRHGILPPTRKSRWVTRPNPACGATFT